MPTIREELATWVKAGPPQLNDSGGVFDWVDTKGHVVDPPEDDAVVESAQKYHPAPDANSQLTLADDRDIMKLEILEHAEPNISTTLKNLDFTLVDETDFDGKPTGGKMLEATATSSGGVEVLKMMKYEMRKLNDGANTMIGTIYWQDHSGEKHMTKWRY